MGDEKEARATLAALQARLARGPYEALNIQAGTVGAAEVRSAFLQLAKIYHPAKFARMSTDVQRLANELFLALRAAHDTLAKPRATPPGSVRQSGSMPALQRPAPAASQPLPITPATRPGAGGRPAVGGRAPTPAIGVPTAGLRPGASSNGMPAMRPAAARPHAAVAGPRPSVDAELATIHELLQKQQWPAVHAALAALVARAPNEPRYQALAHYARGREAQLGRRLDDARVELHEALQLDPDLQIAKTALAELFTRRK